MKSIGITQSSYYDPKRNEYYEKYDSNWTKLLQRLNLQPYPIPNNVSNPKLWIEKANLGGFILTGGNDLSHLNGAKNSSKERDNLEFFLIKYSIENNMPLLGVCRGMQIINYFFNGNIVRINNHVAINHKIFLELNGKYLNKIVNSFHNWGLFSQDLSGNLKVFAKGEDESVEGLYHPKFKIKGIMWHPERITNTFRKFDINLLQNFFLTQSI